MKTRQFNFMLSDKAIENLEVIIRETGVNQTAAVEMSLAFLAKSLTQGILTKQPEAEKPQAS